eukprot:CAMPEP_0197736966 /NCGR_PEP_ID=MMETSP1435-20131217/6015_1 /TAXON_ID=426625 /ORGANISM="Chaetoceros brevis, Strain CCMP164" /LENGTH=44 /DNA_ID= /DNA_START= /DNA_END= /DNA_ORIENTATION=
MDWKGPYWTSRTRSPTPRYDEMGAGYHLATSHCYLSSQENLLGG